MNIDLSKPIEFENCEGAELVGLPVQRGDVLYGWVDSGDYCYPVVWDLAGTPKKAMHREFNIRNAPEVVVDYCNDYGSTAGRFGLIKNFCGAETPIAIIKRTRRLDAQGNLIGLPTYEAIAP